MCISDSHIVGMLGKTNNKIVNRPFPNHVSDVWGVTQLVHR